MSRGCSFEVHGFPSACFTILTERILCGNGLSQHGDPQMLVVLACSRCSVNLPTRLWYLTHTLLSLSVSHVIFFRFFILFIHSFFICRPKVEHVGDSSILVLETGMPG